MVNLLQGRTININRKTFTSSNLQIG